MDNHDFKLTSPLQLLRAHKLFLQKMVDKKMITLKQALKLDKIFTEDNLSSPRGKQLEHKINKYFETETELWGTLPLNDFLQFLSYVKLNALLKEGTCWEKFYTRYVDEVYS